MFRNKTHLILWAAAFLILSLTSCASPPKAKIESQKTAAASPVSSAPSLASIVERKPIPSQAAVEEKDLSVFKKRDFFFTGETRHNFEQVTARPQRFMKEYRERSFGTASDWKEVAAKVVIFLMFLLLMSIAWRGFVLVSLFFRLWRRHRESELFDPRLVGSSTLAPPVSLFLLAEARGAELLHEISRVERLEYEEVELIAFRDLDAKDDDALLLKDFRLRYRSPLYFADLESEDPFEILEVEGERRILLVYSGKRDRQACLTLFLKLARYPLVGFLRDGMTLDPQALAKLVSFWLREGERPAAVYGFLEKKGAGPLRWERMLLGGKDCAFMIAQKNLLIATPSQASNEELCSYEVVGREERSPSLRARRGNPVKIAWNLTVILWPIVLLGLVILKAGFSILFLAGSEIVLIFITAVIWLLFSKNVIQNVFPKRMIVPSPEKQEMMS